MLFNKFQNIDIQLFVFKILLIKIYIYAIAINSKRQSMGN